LLLKPLETTHDLNFLRKVIGPPRPIFIVEDRVSHSSTGGTWIYVRVLEFLSHSFRGIAVALSGAMNFTDKKTPALALQEPSQDTEQLLLERLKNSSTDDEYFRWMLFVVGFYRGINKIEAATELLQGFIVANKNLEQSAHCHLALGQIATDEQRFETALKHFTSAVELAPKKRKVLYVLHNNIGYCRNKLGDFVEAEKHCRSAIDIDWTRASGYRNLGVSLHGQGNIIGAAWVLAEAVKTDAADDRARLLLEKLIAHDPSIGLQCPWILQALNTDPKSTPEVPLT
jgi:tetratricopeptide (TPR) repeat protein